MARNNFKNTKNSAIVKAFNSHKNLCEYSRILDTNPLYADRHKCKDCGEDIFYNNVVLAGAWSDHIHINSGSSHLSSKTVNGVTYKLCVCESCMVKKFPELRDKNISRIYNRPTIYAEYAFDIPHADIADKNKELCVRSKEQFVRKYGEEEGNRRWNAYITAEAITNTFAYKNAKYGMTHEEFVAYNKSRSCTKENFIKRHGEVDGMRKWEEYCIRQGYTNTVAYFIEKYGEENGRKRYNSATKRKHTNGHSAISSEMFGNLIADDFFTGHDIRYYDHGGELEVYDKDHGVYYLDFVDMTANICIEFNGLKFHSKPGIYKPSDTFANPYQKVPSLVSDIYRKDEQRKFFIENELGLKMFVVWEDEYINDKQAVIHKLISDIKKWTSSSKKI